MENSLRTLSLGSFFLALFSWGLGGCTMQAGDFPSLAKRPVEDVDVLQSAVGQAEPAEVNSVAGPQRPVGGWSEADSATVAALDDLAKKFQASVAIFESAKKNAASANIGTEAWVQAQQALTEVSRAQSETAVIVADLDRKLVDTQVLSSEAGAAAAQLQMLWAKADEQLRGQQHILDRLNSR